MENGFWFQSSLFKIKAREDEETNPGCYGKSLAEWLCGKLSLLGYDAEVIPEDWGWCVMCSRDGYMLWVGCGAMQGEGFYERYDPDNPPNSEDVTWHVFTCLEIPFFMLRSHIMKLMGKLDVKSPEVRLRCQLKGVLESEQDIIFCDEP